jgi:hypothetical protein
VAQKVQTLFVDDIDGSAAEGTIRFGLDGTDYEIDGNEVRFVKPIIKEEIGTGRWLAMYLGLFGTYRKDETIDLQFSKGGKVELRSDLKVIPYAEGEGP